MMDIFKAVDKVGQITEFCKTRNIWDILDRLDICYDTKDLGSPQTGLKGYCTLFFGIYFIMVNRHLASHLQALVAWHELGHIILDPELLTEGNCLFDSTFCNEATGAELRANIFAAEGLIEDDDIIDLIHNGYTRKSAASQLMVPIPFIDYKIKVLHHYDVLKESRLTQDGDAMMQNHFSEQFYDLGRAMAPHIGYMRGEVMAIKNG